MHGAGSFGPGCATPMNFVEQTEPSHGNAAIVIGESCEGLAVVPGLLEAQDALPLFPDMPAQRREETASESAREARVPACRGFRRKRTFAKMASPRTGRGGSGRRPRGPAGEDQRAADEDAATGSHTARAGFGASGIFSRRGRPGHPREPAADRGRGGSADSNRGDLIAGSRPCYDRN